MAASKSLKVGLIIGSQRVVRVGPQIADFILNTLKSHEASLDKTTPRPAITFDRIDIAGQSLPIFDEPIIPQQIKSSADYANEHTRLWSRRINSLDAVIFLSAQRNWGIPAELKNGIDYLYHEWKGKPAMLVTYGGHGGVQCAEQLRTVLGSIGMKVMEKMVHMKFPGAEFRGKAFKGQPLGLDIGNDSGPWAEHRSEITSLFDEMVDKMVD